MEKLVLKVTILSAVLNIGLNLFFIPAFDMNGAAITTVIAEFIVLSISFYYSRGKWEFYLSFRFVISCIVGCLLLLLYLYLINNIFSGMILRLFVAILGAALVYGISLILLRNEFALYMLSLLKKRLRHRR